MINLQYLELAQQQLSEFADRDDFVAKMELAFGNRLVGVASRSENRSPLASLRQQWQQGDFSALPAIEVLQNGELGTANGAYAAATQKIYLSSTFLATATTEQIVGVLIEEIGHSIDTILNTADSIGDEGALFSELVRGHNLSASDITSLQSEDDRALVTIDGQQIWVEQNNVTGTAGNDTLVGATTSGDTISGLAGNDSLTGLSGNDTLIGGSGSDTLTGGAGSDTFVLENFNNNIFSQDADVATDFVRGTDKIDVSGLGISDFSTISALTANETTNSVVSAVITTRNTNASGYGYSLQLTNINKNSLAASDFNFAIATTNDNITGSTRNDDLFGGFGDDTLNGGDGNDRLFGEAGTDRLVGGTGSDTLTGGAGNDTFVLENFNNNIFAQDADVATDFLRGTDKIDVSGLGISDFSTILALTANESINSVTSAVITTNNTNANGYGYSLQLTSINKNLLSASDFNFATAATNDNIAGSTRNDDLFGGFGDDTLNGGDGNDRLFGEAGTDRLVGGTGSDTLTGGAGNDTFVLENFNNNIFSQDADVATDFVQGTDKIDVSGLGISDFSTILAVTSNDVSNSAVIATSNTNANGYGYSLKLTGINKNSLVASDFNFATTTFDNALSGSDRNDDLFGGLGNDPLNGGDGNDRLFGENGNDRLVGGSGSDTFTGGAGSDTFVLENFNNNIFAQDADVVTDFVRGVDKIDVSGLGISDFSTILAVTSNDASNNAVIATSNNNANGYGYSFKLNGINKGLLAASDFNFATTTFNNALSGADRNDDLFGGLGNDPLSGGTGDDRIFGENGNDTLTGGGGKDMLYGGLGNDTYIVQNNLAGGTVIDDAGGTDTLQLSATVNTTNGFSKSGTSLLIDLNADALFNASDLTIKNFFNNVGGAGTGFIENLANFTSSSLVNQLKVARNDFNADGKSDILWRNDFGSVALWQMNGATVTSANLTSVTDIHANWKAAGTGDFNGDGKSDILWRNTDGSIAVWAMNGATVTSSTRTSTPSLDNSWTTAGTGDYNGDGKSDILWRNTNGAIAVWTMDGATVTSSSLTSTSSLDPSWKVAGNSDFDGDGKSDILWRNDDGSVVLWQMNGSGIGAATAIAKVTTDWKIAGTGDFNNDAKADILWRNDDGRVVLWQMNNTAITSSTLTSTPSRDSSQTIAGISDYNGDGNSDILWRKDTGALEVWQMNGSAVVSSTPTSVAADGGFWKIAAPII